MRSRKTNMLEAFRASALQGSRRAEGERAGAPSEGPASAPEPAAPAELDGALDGEALVDAERDAMLEHAAREEPAEERAAEEPAGDPGADGERASAGAEAGVREDAPPERVHLRIVRERGTGSGDAPEPESPERARDGAVWRVAMTRRMLSQIALFQLVLLSLFFFMGRASVAPARVAAAGVPELGARNEADALARALGTPVSGELRREGAAPSDAPVVEARSAETFAPRTASDRAFWSTKNAYSVRAIQYPRTDHGEKMAWQTYDYLKAQGLPVVTPLAKGEAILICVGAKPAMAELEELHDRVRELPGPQPDIDRRPFRSAYLVNIEDVVGKR
jgi:hypothetical protein